MCSFLFFFFPSLLLLSLVYNKKPCIHICPVPPCFPGPSRVRPCWVTRGPAFQPPLACVSLPPRPPIKDRCRDRIITIIYYYYCTFSPHFASPPSSDNFRAWLHKQEGKRR